MSFLVSDPSLRTDDRQPRQPMQSLSACHPVEKHVKNVEAGLDFITFIDDTT